MPEKFLKRLKEYTKKAKEAAGLDGKPDYSTLEKNYGVVVNKFNQAASIARNDGSNPENLKNLYEAKNEYLAYVAVLKQTIGKKEAAKIRANPKYTINDSLD